MSSKLTIRNIRKDFKPTNQTSLERKFNKDSNPTNFLGIPRKNALKMDINTLGFSKG